MAEDYRHLLAGFPQATVPYFQTTYQQALTDAGILHDVYDVDARGRRSPTAVGVMSHYDAVVWETGADLYTREPTQPGGTGVSKLLDDEVLAMREYMNAGGKVLVAGKEPLQGVRDQFLYNPDQAAGGALVQVQPDDRPERRGRPGRPAQQLHRDLQRLPAVLARRLHPRGGGADRAAVGGSGGR